MNAVISTALGRFEWPTPPHFNRVGAPAIDGAEHGLVMMNDGRKLVGNVVRLDTGASVLEFQMGPGRANLMIDFSAFKSLCLSQMIALERVPLIVPLAQAEANPLWKNTYAPSHSRMEVPSCPTLSGLSRRRLRCRRRSLPLPSNSVFT